MDKKYSVLMSVYQKEVPEHFFEALSSMVNQSIKPNEIIVVQDGPLSEDLHKVLQDMKQQYPDLIRVIVSEENIGLGRALNLGIQHCKNELIARMDTDDISLPNRCEKQLEIFSKYPELSLVGTDIAEFIDAPDNIIAYRLVPETHNHIIKYLKYRCPFNHMTVMFKKSIVQKSGGYQHWIYNEDYFLWIRLFLNEALFYNIKTPLVFVRVGSDMYKRRGGKVYFKSEAQLQSYMRKHKIISRYVFSINVLKRFVVQILLPNRIRGWVFKKFARDLIN